MKKTMKNAISSLTAKLAALLLAFTCAGSAWGAADTSWYDASQTSFTLTTEAQLRGLAQLVNAGNAFSEKTITLGADIDVGSEEWVTIATSGDSTKFAGTFDGDGHTISNLFIDQSDETPAYRAAGFFGAINGTVKNLKFVNANVVGVSSGSATVNGIAVAVGSMAYGGTIDNVSVENATVRGNRYVAGIVGYAQGTVQNCTIKNVTIVAEPDKLTGSYDNGDKAGGIVGYCNGAVTIKNNTIAGDFDIRGYRDIAGIVGCGGSGTTLVGNSVADDATVTVTIDQVTGNYGTKTANAGVLAGRVNGATGENGGAIDDSNSVSSSATTKTDTAVAVAQIGTVQYGTLEAATRAYQSGDTIEILGDASSMTAPEGWVINPGTPATLSVDPMTTWTKVADGFYQSAEKYVVGNGMDIYITSKAGLEYFRDLVNGVTGVADVYASTYWNSSSTVAQWYSNNIFNGMTVHLMTDIDLGNEEWAPIGQPQNALNTKCYFYGHFNGENHTISNLKATQYTEATKTWYAGLFGMIGAPAGQTISNLTINNVTLIGYDYAGAIVGNAGSNPTAFNNCHVTGNIDIKCMMTGAFVGGIVGIGTSAITDCSVEGSAGSTIEGSTVGGLAGTSTRSANASANTVAGSTVTGVTVKSDDNGGQAGGLVGKATNPVTVTGNTVHDVTVSAEAGKADVLVGGVGGDVTASSNTTDTNVTVISDPITGSGTQADPYIIANIDALKAFRDRVNAGNNYAGKFFKLTANVDLNNEEWEPIGTSSTPFNGVFDGDNHTISNLKITGNSSDVGFFGRTNSGEIKNLTINNAQVSGYLDVGVVAGNPYTSKYTNISLTGHVEVNGFAYVGGMLGKNAYADLTALTVNVDSTSYVKANSVSGSTAYRTYVGGVVGFMGEGNITVRNVTSNIKVIGSTCDVGGIVGIAHYDNKFINCTCSGDVVIEDSLSLGAAQQIGGIAGVWNNATGHAVLFEDCTYTGNISSSYKNSSGDTVQVPAEELPSAISGAPYSGSGTGEVTVGSDIERDASGKIIGGTFETIPDSALAEGFGPVANEQGLYTVEALPLIATVTAGGTTKNYYDLHKALEAGKADGSVVTLQADVDLAGVAWTPVGTTASPFYGSIDGNGKTISNLTINDPTLDYAGLIGYGNGGTPAQVIKDLTISNATITARMYVGVLGGCLYANNSISNVTVKGLIQVTGNYMVGGVVGQSYIHAYDSAIVGDEGSFVKGLYLGGKNDVVGGMTLPDDCEGDNVGGFIGHMGEGSGIGLFNCSASGLTVMGSRKVGGLVGTLPPENSLENVNVSGVTIGTTATADYATAKKSTMEIGGVVGSYYNNGTGGVISGTVQDVTIAELPTGVTGTGDDKNISYGLVTGGNRGADPASKVNYAALIAKGYDATKYNNSYLINNYTVMVTAPDGSVVGGATTLPDAVTLARANDTISLLANVTLSERITIAKTVTLDLNGYTLTLPESDNRGIYVDGSSTLTIKTTNEGGSVVHAFADTTQTIISIYVRSGSGLVLESGTYSVPGEFIYNNGGTITITDGVYTPGSGKRVIWTASGTSSVTGGYFSETLDLRSWVPESKKLAKVEDGTYAGYYMVRDFNDSDYIVQNVNKDKTYLSLTDALAEAEAGDTINILAGECRISNTSVIPAGVTINGAGSNETVVVISSSNGSGIKINNPNVTISNLTIYGGQVTSGGYKSVINVTADGVLISDAVLTGGGGSTWNSSILVEQLNSSQTFTVRNSTISGSFRGVLRESCNGNIVIDNCDIDAVYPFNIDGGNGGTVTVTDSALHGWTSYSGVDSVTFTNCEFSKAKSGYDCVAAYVDTTFEDCTFASTTEIYAQTSGFTFELEDCTKNGVALTWENMPENFEDSNVWNKCTCLVDGDNVLSVAEVNGHYYTLADALTAAQSGDTIKLVKDVNDKLYTVGALPEGVTFDGNGYEYTIFFGAGTAEDPYGIYNKATLAAFRDSVNGGTNYAGKVLKQMASIDLNGVMTRRTVRGLLSATPADWEPIMDFGGVYDGNGMVISNLSVNAANRDYVGLFGRTASGSMIKNVTIENVNLIGRGMVGSVIGQIATSTVASNLVVRGHIQVTGNYKVGGIVGWNYAYLYDCSITGDEGSFVEGVYLGTKTQVADNPEANDYEGDNVGGIIGHLGEGAGLGLYRCSASGLIVKGTRKVGGLVGTFSLSSKIEDASVSDITLGTTATLEYANDNKATMQLGGIVGGYFGTAAPSVGTISGTVRDVTVLVDEFAEGISFAAGNVNYGLVTGGYRSLATPNPENFLADWSGVVAVGYDETKYSNSYLIDTAKVAIVTDAEGALVGKYPTLADAATAATAGCTIGLLQDIADAGAITLASGVTLDGANLKLSGDVSITLDPAGGTVQNVDFSNVKSSRGTIACVITATPAADAEFTITGNTFNTPGAVNQILIDAASATDFTATITGNVFNLEGNRTKRAFAVVNAADAAKLTLDGNYIADGLWFGASADGANVSEKAYPQLAAADAAEATVTLPTFIIKKNAADGKPMINGYATLAAATDGAATGDTIFVTGDATLDAAVTTSKNLTIDGQGKTLTASGSWSLKGVSGTLNGVTTMGNITLQNITLKYDDADTDYTTARLGGNVTLGENVTIDASAVTDDGALFGTGVTVAAGTTPTLKVGDSVAAGQTLISSLTLGENASVGVTGLPTGLYDAIADGSLALRTQEATVTVGETVTYYNTLQEALNAAATAGADATVDVLCDVDLTGKTWTPVSINANNGGKFVTVNGGNHTITGLTEMLFSGTWAGNTGLAINDLTIKDSAIVHDPNDTKGDQGVGAFIGWPQASQTISLTNCHLVNSSVEGGHWTGGLVGIAAGYSGNDGPVFETVTISGCSVENSTIKGKGSAGGVIGHGSSSDWTKVIITDTTVTGNTVTSTGSSTDKAGAVCGTVGVAGQEKTVNGVTHEGGIEVSATVTGNTASSGGTATTAMFGRIGSDGGELAVTGGTYDGTATYANDSYDSNNGKIIISGGTFQTQPSQDAIADGYVAELSQDVNGWWTVGGPFVAKIGNVGYATLAEAVAAAVDGDTVELLADAELTGTIEKGDAISFTIDGNGFTVKPADGFSGASAFLLSSASSTSLGGQNCTITNATFSGFTTSHGVLRIQGATVTVTGCTFSGNVVTSPWEWDVISSNYAAVTVDGCTFQNNTSGDAIIGIGNMMGSTGTATGEPTVIKNSLFTGNTTTVAEIFIGIGQGKTTVESNTFSQNSDGIAVVYASNSADITGNLFDRNAITGTGANMVTVLAGPYGYSGARTVNVTDNAFEGNTKANGSTADVFLEDQSAGGTVTGYDISGNYWGDGEAPVAGVDYVAQREIELSTYATAYAANAEGYGVGVTESEAALAQILRNDTVVGYYWLLQEAASAAQDGDTIELLRGTSGETVTVAKSVTITGASDGSGKPAFALTNTTITVNGATVELAVTNLAFAGSSYVNANNGKALTVDHVTATVDPTKISGRSAFIVVGTGESQTGLDLTVTNSEIVNLCGTDGFGAAIFGWAFINSATICDNVLGSDDHRFKFIAIKLMNAVDGAVYAIERNTIYGTNADYVFLAIDLYQNNSRANSYTALSKNNVLDVTKTSGNEVYAFDIERNGSSSATIIVLDSGSTLNGQPVAFGDFVNEIPAAQFVGYYGAGVVYDESGKMTAGTFSRAFTEEELSASVASGLVSVSNLNGTYRLGTAVAKIGNEYFGSLADAYDASVSGDTIELLADVDVPSVILIGKSLTIDGKGHKITTSTATRIFRIAASNIDVTFKNAEITSTVGAPGNDGDNRGISVDNMSNDNITLDNVKLTAPAYAFNCSGGSGNLTVVIKDSEIKGWAAINTYSDDSTFTITNSTLTGYNDKSFSEWHNFGAIIIDGSTSAGSRNTITLADSTVVTESTTGNLEYWVIPQRYAADNAIILTGTSKVQDANGANDILNFLLYSDDLTSTITVPATIFEGIEDVDGKLREKLTTRTDNNDGTYTIKVFAPVAKIGSTYYESFDAAAAAADAAVEAGEDDPVIHVVNIPDGTVLPAGWAFDETQTLLERAVAQNVTISGETVTTNKQYSTLQAAIDDAAAGDTIEVIRDVLTEGAFEITKSVAITGAVDADGKPIYTIMGIEDATSADYADIYVGDDGAAVAVTISNLKLTGFGNEAAGATDYQSSVVTFDAYEAGSTLTVTNVEFSSYNQYAVATLGDGTLAVQGCKIDGTATGRLTGGVYAENGAATVSGGTIENVDVGIDANDAAVAVSGAKVTANENGTAIASTGGAAVTVDGGDYAGALDVDGYSTLTIESGHFDRYVDETYCGDGKIAVPWTAGPEGWYEVIVGQFVAAVIHDGTTTPYASLESAIAAAQSGDTVKLLADVAITTRVSLKSGLTLDGDGHTISPANSAHFSPDSYHDGYNMLEVPAGVTGVTIKNVTVTSFNATENKEMANRHLIAVSGQATIQDVTLHQYTAGFERSATSGKRGADALQTNGDCTIAGNLSIAVGEMVWSPISLNNSSAANTVRFADGATLEITEDLRPAPQQATIRTHGFTTATVEGADNVGYVPVLGAALGTNNNLSGYEPADSPKVGSTEAAGTVYNYKVGSVYYTTFALAASVAVDTENAVENFADPAEGDGYTLAFGSTLQVVKNGHEPAISASEPTYLVVQAPEDGLTTYSTTIAPVTVTHGGDVSYFATLEDAFAVVADGDTVTLLADVTLNADAAATPEAAANVTLAQGEFSITANGHAIALSGSPLLTVTTDKQTDAFDAADGYVIVESGSYVYTPTKIVAMIGETPYTSFDDAVEAWQDGDTITVVGYDDQTMVAPEGWKFVTDTSVDPAVTTLVQTDPNVSVTDGTTTKTYETLQQAFDAAHEMSGDVTVTMLTDIAEYAVIHQKAGLNVTVDGQGKTLAGQIIIDGDGRSGGTETLTIQNVKFEDNKSHFYTGTDAFILVPSTKANGTPYYTGKYNYAHNVTVTDCSFTSTSASLDVVGYKATSGATQYNMKMANVTGTNLHSLAQLTATEGSEFDNCTVTASDSFINIDGGGQQHVIKNCSFTSVSSDGYGVREKGSSSAVITLENNNFKTAKVFQLGKSDAPSGTIKVVSGTYDGDIVLNMNASGTAKYEISGGYFPTTVLPAYCAPNYVPVDAEEGAPLPYTVVEAVAEFRYPIEGTSGIPVTTDWFTNYLSSIYGSDPTAPVRTSMTNELVQALSADGANGMPLWQSYVLGQDPTDPNATLRLTAGPVAGNATKVAITGVIDLTNKPTVAGTTVTFRLASRNADGTWADIEDGAATPSFEVSLDDVAGKVLAIFADIVTE